MKIALVASGFLAVPPKKYGGTERIIYHLINGLQELGHQVTLFATADSEVSCELIPIVKEGIKFGMNDAEKKEVIKKGKQVEARTLSLIKENAHRFDIVHSHGLDLKGYYDTASVTTLHGMFLLDQMDYYETRKDLGYVTISENQRESFPDLNYVGNAYNGLDPDDFPTVLQPKDYLSFIGRFDREKNPHLAIELALAVGIPIKVAGKIDHLAHGYFDTEVEPYFEHDLVEYLGEIGMQEKIDLLSNAKANLHPTGFREPFGLTVLEAAYCGTPTLAIAKGSMPELIEDSRTGILVEDFAEAYHHLDDCFNLDRNYISTRARSLFNYHNMAKDYVEAYEKSIEEFDTNNHEELVKKTHSLLDVPKNYKTSSAKLSAFI